jgi:hypothetical protein
MKFNIALVLLLSFSWFAPTAFAQEAPSPLNITVSPYVIELATLPGKSVSQKIRIKNNAATPVDLKLDVVKMEAKGDAGDIVPVDTAKDDESLSWVSFDEDTLTVVPNEWGTTTMTISTPEEAAFGYYYAVRISEASANADLNQPGTSLSGQVLIATLLNVQKAGAKAEAKITDFKAKSTLNEYLPVDFITRVANTGNIHVKPRGNIFVSGWGQKDIAILEVNEGLGNVLPSSEREFGSAWSDGFIVNEAVTEEGKVKLDEKGKPVKKLKINWNKLTSFRFGKYDARLVMVYDGGNKDITIESTTSFWIVPYTILAVILGVLIFFVVGIKLLLRSYVRRQLKKYQQSNK